MSPTPSRPEARTAPAAPLLPAPLLPAVLTALAVLLTAPVPAEASEPLESAAPDPAAVAARAVEAMGGEDAWDHARLLSFHFAGRRTHHWDRTTGRHRLEGETQDGESYVIIEHLDSRQGRAWVEGREVTGERAEEMVEMAYGAWVNDTYWMLMPLKLTDPGVNLTYEGTEVVDGETYDVLGLTFEDVGLTPGDRYWAWISRRTGLMDRWAYRLQSQPEDAEPTVWLWQEWEWYGPQQARVRLAAKRTQLDGGRILDMRPIEVSATVPAALFTAP